MRSRVAYFLLITKAIVGTQSFYSFNLIKLPTIVFVMCPDHCFCYELKICGERTLHGLEICKKRVILKLKNCSYDYIMFLLQPNNRFYYLKTFNRAKSGDHHSLFRVKFV